jgi:sec-independent protein translocase protein TatB
MFDIGWGELVVIGVVALIAIGPKELPGVLRTTGQWMGKIRRMANEFQDQFRDAMREAEMADIKKSVDEMTNTASDFTNFDPLGSVRKDIESAVGDAPTFDSKPPEPAAEPSAIESASSETPPAPQLASEPAPQAAAEPASQDARKAGEGA